MKDQLIGIQTAKLAKEKGFTYKQKRSWCNYYEGEPIMKWKLIPLNKPAIASREYAAPTQSLLQKWLREVHNIHLVIRPNFSYGNDTLVVTSYTYNGEKGERNGIFYPTYEEALEAGLNEGLKLIHHPKKFK